MNAPRDTLIVDALASSGAPSVPAGTTERDDAAPRPAHPVVVGVWVLALVVIIAFGVLATFASPLFFLGVLVPFVPLAALAGRSS